MRQVDTTFTNLFSLALEVIFERVVVINIKLVLIKLKHNKLKFLNKREEHKKFTKYV